MKRLFKWLFSTESKSKKYKYEIILICYLILITATVYIIFNFVGLNDIVETILTYFVLIQWFLFIIPWIMRLIDISSYNEKNKVTKGKKKFKFDPIWCKVSEIENWMNNATEPDTLYVKGIQEENITIIEVSFETKGRSINEPWYNKQIWINDKEIKNANEIEEELYRACLIKDDCICLMAITFYDDPKNFYKM